MMCRITRVRKLNSIIIYLIILILTWNVDKIKIVSFTKKLSKSRGI